MSADAPVVRAHRHALVAGAVVLLDQATKALVQQRMALHESIAVIPDFFHLTYIRNPGAAFGLFVGINPSFRTAFFLSVSCLAIGVILYFFFKSIQEDRRRLSDIGDIGAGAAAGRHNRWLRAGLALVMGGAIGNLIDRLRFGEVVDFLDFFIGRYHWPAFNVADSSITIGVSILLAATFLPPEPEPPPAPPRA
jgi:signal peptidase II